MKHEGPLKAILKRFKGRQRRKPIPGKTALKARKGPYNVNAGIPQEGGSMAKTILGQTMYSMQEVAELLGVTTRTITTYLQQGRIAAQKIGGRWHFTEDNLKDFLKGSRQQQKQP